MRSRRILGLWRSGPIQVPNRSSGTRCLDRAPKRGGVVADQRDLVQVQFGEELGEEGGDRRQGQVGAGVHVYLEWSFEKERDPVRSGVPSPRYFGCIRLSPTSRTDRHPPR